jgi:anti-anti-sigma regulatory factor
MMKAQLDEHDGKLTLNVCGRLAEGWIQELEQCWRTARGAHPSGVIWVDLCSVTFIDHAGEALLRRMHQEGAKFLAAGLWNQEVVNQVTGGSK